MKQSETRIGKRDFDVFWEIEWESDAIPLPDMFDETDPDHHFAIYETFFPKENVPGWIAFDFTERDIWQQYKDEQLSTFVCSLKYAEVKERKLAKDYDRAKRDFKKRMKKLNKHRGKLIL